VREMRSGRATPTLAQSQVLVAQLLSPAWKLDDFRAGPKVRSARVAEACFVSDSAGAGIHAPYLFEPRKRET
jgi:hypothetical protein